MQKLTIENFQRIIKRLLFSYKKDDIALDYGAIYNRVYMVYKLSLEGDDGSEECYNFVSFPNIIVDENKECIIDMNEASINDEYSGVSFKTKSDYEVSGAKELIDFEDTVLKKNSDKYEYTKEIEE